MPGKPWVPKFLKDLFDNVDVSTDGELTANSDAKLPTEKAVKTYVDAHAGGGSAFISFTAEVAVAAATVLDATAFGKNHVCSGVASNYPLALPPAAGNAGKVLGVRMAAGLTKLVTLSTNEPTAKAGSVTGGVGVQLAGTGTITAANSTTITGVGTSFTTQLRVGDLITCVVGSSNGGNGGTRRVTAIASNTSATVDAVFNITAGTAFTYTQTGIVGAGTNFAVDFTVGSGITVGGVTRKVTYINGTALAVDVPFLTAPAAAAYGKTSSTIDGQFNRVMWAGESAILLCDGTNWTKIAGKTIPMMSRMYKNYAAPFDVSDSVDTKVAVDTVSVQTVAAMADAANSRIVIQRPGTYDTLAILNWTGGTTYSHVIGTRQYINGAYTTGVVGLMTAAASGATGVASNAIAMPYYNDTRALSQNDFMELWCRHTGSTAEVTSLYGPQVDKQFILVKEVPNW